MMRYLPLSDADRSQMLRVIGASSVDDLFRDVPEEARLNGPIEGLPMHASEMAVERHMTALSRKNMVAGDVPFFLGCGAYKHHIPQRLARSRQGSGRRARRDCCSSC